MSSEAMIRSSEILDLYLHQFHNATVKDQLHLSKEIQQSERVKGQTYQGKHRSSYSSCTSIHSKFIKIILLEMEFAIRSTKLGNNIHLSTKRFLKWLGLFNVHKVVEVAGKRTRRSNVSCSNIFLVVTINDTIIRKY